MSPCVAHVAISPSSKESWKLGYSRALEKWDKWGLKTIAWAEMHVNNTLEPGMLHVLLGRMEVACVYLWLKPWHPPGAPIPHARILIYAPSSKRELKSLIVFQNPLFHKDGTIPYKTETLNRSEALYFYGNFLALLLWYNYTAEDLSTELLLQYTKKYPHGRWYCSICSCIITPEK